MIITIVKYRRLANAHDTFPNHNQDSPEATRTNTSSSAMNNQTNLATKTKYGHQLHAIQYTKDRVTKKVYKENFVTNNPTNLAIKVKETNLSVTKNLKCLVISQ